jgi:hypothetical protein
MSTQKVPIESLQKIRQHLRSVLVLPASENRPRQNADTDDLPEPDSLASLGDLFRFGTDIDEGVPMPNDRGQWFVSVIDPAVALMKLPGLSIQPDYRLVTYLYRVRDEGQGKTWALPAALSTTAQLEKVITTPASPDRPPRPAGALDDVMAAVQGDRSPTSFLIASLLRRELLELGGLGTGSNWRQHQLIMQAPPQVRWQWRTEAVPDLSPKVRILPDGKVVVEMFTCRVSPSVAIFQHLDQYRSDQYVAQSIDRPIAIAEKKAA